MMKLYTPSPTHKSPIAELKNIKGSDQKMQFEIDTSFGS